MFSSAFESMKKSNSRSGGWKVLLFGLSKNSEVIHKIFLFDVFWFIFFILDLSKIMCAVYFVVA